MHEECGTSLGSYQLQLPLYAPLQVDDLSEVALPRKMTVVEEEIFEWSDDHIKVLHMFLLDNALEELKNPQVSIEKKRELLDWMNAPYLFSKDIYKHPFSFQLCCQIAGYDAELMSEGINDRFRNTDVLR